MTKWDRLKERGELHYRNGDGPIQPIDLMRSIGIFKNFALGSIIKYAVRSRDIDGELFQRNMSKVIHYAQLLMAEKEDK
jgi:hypothetical protein